MARNQLFTAAEYAVAAKYCRADGHAEGRADGLAEGRAALLDIAERLVSREQRTALEAIGDLEELRRRLAELLSRP